MRFAISNRHTVFIEFAGWLSLSVLLGVLIAITVQSQTDSQPIQLYLNNMAVDLSEEIAQTLEDDIWNLDDKAISKYFCGLWKHLGLASVCIRTEFNDVLFEKKWSPEPDPVFHRRPVWHNGKTIGFVEVSVSKDRLNTLRQALKRSGLTSMAVAFSAIWLVCLVLARLIIARPLRKIMLGLRTIAGGAYGFQLAGDRSVEIDGIIREINALSSEILNRRNQLESEIAVRRQAEHDLAKLNAELDERVKERTRRLRRMAGLLASAQDAEQRRIAEGLHDDVAQLLAASRMKLQVATRTDSPVKAREILHETEDLIVQANERLRHLSFELASSTLGRLGLRVALDELCEDMSKRYGMNFSFHCDQDPGLLPEEMATVLFKSTRELLFNVAKHAGTDTALVFLTLENGAVKLIVEDHGKGFAPDGEKTPDPGSGLGLFGIRERLQDIGGSVRIESAPGRYSRIILLLPLG